MGEAWERTLYPPYLCFVVSLSLLFMADICPLTEMFFDYASQNFSVVINDL